MDTFASAGESEDACMNRRLSRPRVVLLLDDYRRGALSKNETRAQPIEWATGFLRRT
jgi:hypothetical protein